MSENADQNARVLDQFSQQAEAYAALVNAARTLARDPLIEALAPRPTDRVLDVGCGSGQFAVAIAAHVAQVVGADLTPAMLDKARAQQAAAGVANVEWLQADSAALPVADGAFDIVTSRSMLHHAADPAATLAEMGRACAPGGRIAVLDLTPAPEKAPAFDAIELLRDPSHARTQTVDELRGLGEALGLEELTLGARQRPAAGDDPGDVLPGSWGARARAPALRPRRRERRGHLRPEGARAGRPDLGHLSDDPGGLEEALTAS